VTTTDAAAPRRQRLLVTVTVAFGIASFSLGGCSGSLFDQVSLAPEETAPPPKAVAEAPVAKVMVSTIVGPPDPLGKQLHQEFTSALEKQRVAVVAATDKGADFHLRPYILAAKEKSGTKINYVVDVSDTTGKRVNRFTGEEVVPGNAARDSWSAITPAVAQAVAAKASDAFVAWVPNARTANIAANSSSPPATEAPPKSEFKSSPPPPAKSPRPAAKQEVAAGPPPAPPTTGSIDRKGNGALAALVPAVAGAPGDGSTTLTAAIKRELQAKGVALLDRPGASAYRVEGAVTMGEPREGKQAIQIEWVVKDPQGKRLGTVSQKNDIPEGSLDGAWGRTADQAAGAAVQGIFKLLPSANNRAVN
jgi:hypothetical protein